MLYNNIIVPSTYHFIDTPRKLSWLVKQILASPEFAFDLETTHPSIKKKPKVREYKRHTEIYVCGIAFAWGREVIQTPWKPGLAAYIPLRKEDDSLFWGKRQDEVMAVVRTMLESENKKIAHNAKFDVSETYKKLGIKTKNMYFDTMLAYSLLDEEKLYSSNALKSDYNDKGEVIKPGVADVYLALGSSQWKGDLKDALNYYDPAWKRYNKVPFETLYPYACADADMTLSLKFIFEEMLEREATTWPFYNIAMPLSNAIMHLEMHGCPLNIPRATQVEQEQALIAEAESKWVHYYAGKEFLVSSSEQLGQVLFEHMKFTGGKKNKKGWIVDADELKRLKEETAHPIFDHLLKARRAQKIGVTYAHASLDLVEETHPDGVTGWVHPSIWLDSKTGRLKCRDPNLTNLPRKENGGDLAKSIWECPEGYSFLFSDFSQMELRVIAHVSEEPSWIEGFNSGYDMHSAMAHKIFNLPCAIEDVEDLYSAERSKAKIINFSIAYGKSVYNLAKDLVMEYEDANKLINEDYFGQAPTLKAWIDEVHKFAEREGYVRNIFGRVRHLPNAQIVPPKGVYWPKKEDRPDCYRTCVKFDTVNVSLDDLYSITPAQLGQKIKEHKRYNFFKCTECKHFHSCFINSEVRRAEMKKGEALRQSVNSIIQGTAADMSSLALVWITQELRRYRVDSRPVLYIHDEIGCYTKNEDLEKATRIMDDCMVRRLKEFTGFKVPLKADPKIVKCWGDK